MTDMEAGLATGKLEVVKAGTASVRAICAQCHGASSRAPGRRHVQDQERRLAGNDRERRACHRSSQNAGRKRADVSTEALATVEAR